MYTISIYYESYIITHYVSAHDDHEYIDSGVTHSFVSRLLHAPIQGITIKYEEFDRWRLGGQQ